MRSRLAAAVSLAAIVLATMAFVGPWWSVESAGFGHLGSFTGTTEWGPFGFATSNTMTEPQSSTYDYGEWPQTAFVFLLGSVLLAASLLCGAILLLSVVLPGRSPWWRRLAPLWSAVACGAALAAWTYVAASLPGAVTNDTPHALRVISFSSFWGTESGAMMDSSFTTTWGAGWAWYAVVAASILFLITAILLLSRTPAGATPSPAPATK